MIKLALAIGFMAVFGIVAYAIVLLLTRFFEKDNKQSSNNQNEKQTQNKTNNE